MSIGPVEEVPDHQSVISYRLGQVESAVRSNNETVNKKLDTITGITTDVTTLRIRVESLEKSRDRLIGLVSALMVGLIVLAIQIYFGGV